MPRKREPSFNVPSTHSDTPALSLRQATASFAALNASTLTPIQSSRQRRRRHGAQNSWSFKNATESFIKCGQGPRVKAQGGEKPGIRVRMQWSRNRACSCWHNRKSVLRMLQEPPDKDVVLETSGTVVTQAHHRAYLPLRNPNPVALVMRYKLSYLPSGRKHEEERQTRHTLESCHRQCPHCYYGGA